MPWWWSTRSGISANICQIMLLLIPLRCWIQVFVRYIQFSIIHSRFQRQHMHVNVIIRWPKATSVFQVLSRRPELLCGFMSKYDKLYLRLSICTNWNYFCIIPLKYLTTTQNRTQSGGKMYRDTIENYFNAVSVFWCQSQYLSSLTKIQTIPLDDRIRSRFLCMWHVFMTSKVITITVSRVMVSI